MAGSVRIPGMTPSATPLLVGTSREISLIPQIWEQPLSDERKTRIRVGHVLSMTSGHPGVEPWWVSWSGRRPNAGYSGPFQMYEYCFGWWSFDRVPSHGKLLFEPGSDFYYSNFGLEQFALAMRNISGELVGPYIYDRVLAKIGLPRGVRDNRYSYIPYKQDAGLNFSNQPGWAVGGGSGCNAYEADASASPIGANTIVGSTLRISARDFARLAYLWLRQGRWGDAQLVPGKWIELATRRHVRADGTSPKEYGYTFWVDDQVAGVPTDTFATHGDRCNDSYMIPSRDLIVVRQGNMNVADRPAARQGLIRKLVSAFPAPAPHP
jgi:CubicO group peptidase (beta-lactamase class C family)